MASPTAKADPGAGAGAGALVAGPPDAPPLLMLHGWGASKAIWRGVFRPPLTTRRRLIALDLPGTGQVDLLHGGTMIDLARWVAGEAERLGCRRYDLIGHSMGANVAAHLAALHPGRVASLTLVGGALHSDRLTSAAWYLHPVAGPLALGGARCLAGLAGWLESRMAPADSLGYHRGYMRRCGYLRTDNTLPGLRAQLEGLLSTPARIEALPPGLPVLLLHGARDTVIPVAWAEELAASRPSGTRLVVYPTALHCPMDTHPEEFARDVAAFVDTAAAA